MLNGQRTIVTGAGGFVGANLVRALVSEGAIVHVFVRRSTNRWRLNDVLHQVQFHEIDLTDAGLVERTVRDIDPHAVFHMAKHRGNPALLDYRAAYAANLGATLNLLEAVRGSTTLRRFVHGGSSLEYDLTRSPLRESDAPAPMTVHGVTKAAATMLCQQFAHEHGVPAVVLRLFMVYGPWEGPTRFLPLVITSALDQHPVRVTPSGPTHDWIHVDDVVDACLRAVSADGIVGEVFNVGTGVKTGNDTVVAMVEQLNGRPISRAEPFPVRPWDTDGWVADVSKSEAVLGWRARTPIQEGLRRTFEWFKNHMGEYRACAESA